MTKEGTAGSARTGRQLKISKYPMVTVTQSAGTTIYNSTFRSLGGWRRGIRTAGE
jgi:hypothetical protein